MSTEVLFVEYDEWHEKKAVPGLTRLVVSEAGNLADHGDTPRSTWGNEELANIS